MRDREGSQGWHQILKDPGYCAVGLRQDAQPQALLGRVLLRDITVSSNAALEIGLDFIHYINTKLSSKKAFPV